jgi:PAB-dependent poly(A)-specific ribonuclease subunit 2
MQMENLYAMLKFKSNNDLLVLGQQTDALFFDISSGNITRKVNLGQEHQGTVVVKRQRLVCCGEINGDVLLRDPNSLKVEHRLNAHSGTISDLEVAGNNLITCGFSYRDGNLMQDRILQVFDLRMMKLLSPITAYHGASFIKVHPKLASTIMVVSQLGSFQVCDLGTLMMAPQFYQVDTDYISSFDISESGNVLAFGDMSGNIRIWSNSEHGNVNNYPNAYDPLPPPPILKRRSDV